MESLQEEWGRAEALFSSGVPVYNNGGKLEVDEPQLPPLTITPKAKPAEMGTSGAAVTPMGDVALPGNTPPSPDKPMYQNVDWNDPEQAAQYGTQELRAWTPDTRHNLGYWLTDTLTSIGLDPYKARALSERVMGSGDNMIGVADLAILPGAAMGIEEGIHQIGDAVQGFDAGRDAYGDLAMGVGTILLSALGLGGATKKGAQTLVKGAQGIANNAGTITKTAAATAAVGAGMYPEDAEGGVLQKLMRPAKGTVTKLGKAEGETAVQFVERMNREAPIVTNPNEFKQLYGDVPVTSAEQPSDAVAWRMAADKDTVPQLPTGTMGEKETAASPFAQIGGYFDSLTRMKNGGAPREWANSEHARQIIDEAAAEVKYQLNLGDPRKADFTKKTGWGWYDEDTQRMFNTAAKTMPELGMNSKRGVKVPWNGNTDNVTPEQSRILLAAVGAPQSFGNPASRNADIALQAYEVFRKTGQFPEKGIYLDNAGQVLSTDKYWTQRAVSEQYIGVLNTLIREVGPAQAADWLVSPHTIGELRDLKRRATNADGEKIFNGDGTMGISGKASEIKPGAFIFGPKGGQFMGNLLGFPGTTTDMWFTRSWNRYLGKSREGIGALSETGLVEQPRNLAERADMADFSKRLTDQLNQDQALVGNLGRPMTERDTQAVLWYFEQFLYNEMGVRVKPTSFGEGASAYAKRAKEQGGTGIQRR